MNLGPSPAIEKKAGKPSRRYNYVLTVTHQLTGNKGTSALVYAPDEGL